MKICVIGTGYVGLVAGTCLAEMGNTVICVDKDTEKLERLSAADIPIYEPGLEELIHSNVSEGRLSFSSDLADSVKSSEVCFIAVGTPEGADGEADLSAVYEVAKQIGIIMSGNSDYKLIVNKSTAPIGTAHKLKKIIQQETSCEFDIVSNPEFLKQGAAVDDFLKPDRIVIGVESERASKIMQEIYAPFLRTGNPVLLMDLCSAEMTKYASNAFLAMKISYANMLANLCEKTGADVDMVRKGMSLDSRIGSKFLFAGLGYGGSCFPKDVKALIGVAKKNDCDESLLKAIDEINVSQRKLFAEKIIQKFEGDINGKTIAVWGLSFKPKTNDMREAPSVDIINSLLEKGAKIQAFDPKAFECAFKIFGDKISYMKNAYDALAGAECMLLLTEWNEFRLPDFDKMKSLMKKPIIFDGRNQYETKVLEDLGFEYYCIGKGTCKSIIRNS